MRPILLAIVLHATFATKHVTTVSTKLNLRRDGDRAHHRRLPPSGSGGGGNDNILESQNTGGSGPHPLLELVDPDANVNRQGSARPLQLCQGDCTTDGSCEEGLVCWKRNNDFSPSEVPGCDGEALGNADYCVEAKYAQSFPELTFVGHRGPLGECAGDCDSNDDCFGELVCYQQSGATDADDSVPGCPGTAQDNVDYCVDKKKVEQSGKYLNFVMQGDPNLEPGSLKRCQGDCDSDEDCKAGLYCFHRNDRPVPNCKGVAVANVDYCVPRPRTPNPTRRPTPPTPRPTKAPTPVPPTSAPEEEIKEEEGEEGEEEEEEEEEEEVPIPPEESKDDEEGGKDGEGGGDSTPGDSTGDGDTDGSTGDGTDDTPTTEEPTVPVPSPTEPAAPTTDSPDDPEDYPFSVFLSTAVMKEPEDVVAVSETGDEADTEVPVPILEGRSSPGAKFAGLSNIVSEVLNQLFSQSGYDVINDALPNRRLVALTNDGISSQTVPVTSSAQGSAPYEWVAFKTDYIVTDFTPNENLGGARRTQEDTKDNQQLTGEEIEGAVKSIVSTAIEDGTLLKMLQRRDPNILGVANFGEEASTDVDISSIPPPAPTPVAASTRGTEPSDSPKQPWWVWFLVALAGFALLVLAIFAVKRRNKDENTPAGSTRDAPPDNGKSAILAVAPTFDNDESDDEQNAPHWGDGSRLEDLSNQFGVHPFDETNGSEDFANEQPPPPPDLPEDSVLYRQHPELFLAANSGSHRLDTVEL